MRETPRTVLINRYRFSLLGVYEALRYRAEQNQDRHRGQEEDEGRRVQPPGDARRPGDRIAPALIPVLFATDALLRAHPSGRHGCVLQRLAGLLRLSAQHQKPYAFGKLERLTRIVFANGSRILSLPGTPRAVRGYTADLLIIDEAAWVLDEVYGAADPMLAVTGGRLVALSTPWGRRGWFFREWTEGGASWHRVKVTAYGCKRITAEFLEERRRSMPAMVFASEYECRFTDTVDSLFRTEDIERAFTSDVQPLFTKRFLP